jgi:phosphoglycerate dehydrogenase-like enzyme
MKMKLLLTGAYNYTQEQFNRLADIGYEIVFVQDERIPLEIEASDINAIVCNSLFMYNDIAKFESLRIIQLTSAGTERVPIEYIRKNEILLFNAKGVYSIPMAEWTILKILEIYKQSRYFYNNQANHKWNKNRELLELTGKTTAIIGFGSVGTEIAKRLKAFDSKVIGVGRREIDSKFIDMYINVRNIDSALENADIVVITLPLTSSTRRLFNKQKLMKMKDDAVLINISRGEIIDENALIELINDGKFLGVALDVFENEPLDDSSLWDYENVIVTPHNSFVSDKVNERLFELIVSNLSVGDKI